MTFRHISLRLPLLAMLLTVIIPASAQKDDIGSWIGADVKKSINDRLSVGGGLEYRLNDELSATERFSLCGYVDYKLLPWLKASATYLYLHGRQPEATGDNGKYLYDTYWFPRHRTYVDLTGSLKLGNFKLSLRERWMYTYRPEYDRDRTCVDPTDEEYGIESQSPRNGSCENVLRSRLQAQYVIDGSKFEPYASFESFNIWAVQKVRYSIGTSYKIDKKNSLKLYYLFEDLNQRSGGKPVKDSHVIGFY